MLYEGITKIIIQSSLEVMKELGAGFLESVYQNAIQIALIEKGMKVAPQALFVVKFHGKPVGNYLADLLVEDKVIIELKSVERILPEHQAQVINYLNAAEIDVGLLINFGHPKVEIRRLYRSPIKIDHH